MALRTFASNPADLPRGTLVDLLLGAVDRLGTHDAFRVFTGPGAELSAISYRELLDRVKDVVGGLRVLRLERGQCAAILSENRLEWALTDYACLCEGVYAVPVHAVLTADQVGYILNDSGARVVFASTDEQVEKARKACVRCEHEVRIVAFDPVQSPAPNVLPWDQLVAEGHDRMRSVPESELRARAREATPDDIATILYTSGTTGDPKGVVLTHRNLFSNVEACGRALAIRPSDSTLAFLPLSHVFQRMVNYLLVARGCTITFPHSNDTIVADLQAVEPTIVCAVPRVYEKVHYGALGKPGLAGKLVRWAREVGVAWAVERLAGRTPTLSLRVAHRLADRLVFRKIRALLGGRVRILVSGSAPLDPEIARFFYAAGLAILEGYGLTETSPVTNVNTPEELRIGTVGKPVAGTEIKIADDGEILIRGPQVMRGYYELPEETAKAIDAEGWFYTGDIGELDADGSLRITDRKKDLIKTSGGKVRRAPAGRESAQAEPLHRSGCDDRGPAEVRGSAGGARLRRAGGVGEGAGNRDRRRARAAPGRPGAGAHGEGGARRARGPLQRRSPQEGGAARHTVQHRGRHPHAHRQGEAARRAGALRSADRPVLHRRRRAQGVRLLVYDRRAPRGDDRARSHDRRGARGQRRR